MGERYESIGGTNRTVLRIPHPQCELEHLCSSLSHCW